MRLRLHLLRVAGLLHPLLVVGLLHLPLDAHFPLGSALLPLHHAGPLLLPPPLAHRLPPLGSDGPVCKAHHSPVDQSYQSLIEEN